MGNFVEHVGEFVMRAPGRIVKFFKNAKGSKRIRRYAPLGIVAFVAIITFATCVPHNAPAPDEPSLETPVISETPVTAPPSPSETPVETPVETTTEPSPEPTTVTEPEYTGPVDPLTGLPTETDISGNRPLAIMINNHRQAQPQLGVSKADIIYETLAEGGITRMLAIFQDVTDVGVIGSIRSARLYYVDIAQSYDAIFIFAGGSDEAYTALSNRKITRLDGVNGSQTQIFYRDPNRKNLDFEHQLVTSSDRIAKYFPTYNLKMEHDKGYTHNLSFAKDGTPENGYTAMNFTVKFSSNSKTTSFSYNTEDMLYYLSQYGGDYKDGDDKSQVAVTNVLILQTSISAIPGDTAGRLKIVTKGTGTGYFVCGGRYIEINWSRANDTSQFVYTLKDGTPLVLGQGKTYVCIVSKTVNVEIS